MSISSQSPNMIAKARGLRVPVVLSERQRLREAFGVIFSQVLMHGSDIRAALHAW
jgi:hypothetical protein